MSRHSATFGFEEISEALLQVYPDRFKGIDVQQGCYKISSIVLDSSGYPGNVYQVVLQPLADCDRHDHSTTQTQEVGL